MAQCPFCSYSVRPLGYLPKGRREADAEAKMAEHIRITHSTQAEAKPADHDSSPRPH